MKKESSFKSDFIKALKKKSKITAALQYKQDSSTVKGFPDTIILGPEAVTVYIEFKQHKNAKFQPLQKEWGEKLKANNFLYYLVYPENSETVLKELMEIFK